VEVFDRVAKRIERSGGAGFAKEAHLDDPRQKTVYSAVVLADSLPRPKLIVFTRKGTMARYVANLRPQYAHIFAFTPNECVSRQLALCWGVHPVLLDFTDDPNSTIEAAEKYLCEAGLTRAGDNLVILSDLRASGAQVDSIQVRQAKASIGASGPEEASMMD
ncbi:MAG: pyruvate kinase, partial [Acidobacteria bacterium]|nr:pyruvate kinase [Acidobacteriota bacterium]